MRSLLALTLIAGLSLPALAQDSKPPAPIRQAPPAPGAAAQPEAAKGMPVPDGPVVKSQELEGIIIEDITIGDGPEVKPHATLVSYYHGTLKADPSVVFDSAFDRGEPMAFALDDMVQGWQKGVPGMKVGGVRRLTVPAALGYGSQGRGPKIPPNSDLVFIIQTIGMMQVEDVKVGDGEAVQPPFVAVTAQTVFDADGKELSKHDAAHPYIWIPGEMFMQSLRADVMQQAMEGMKVGGKRRVTLPKDLNVGPPAIDVARPVNVPVTFELELIAVRNLPQQGRR